MYPKSIHWKWGKLYQWGRKYGQGYGNNLDDVGDDATTPIKDYAPVSLPVGNDESNSNIFYYDEENWLKYGGECTLWNSGTEEVSVRTEYDPCPGGWRVPTYNELQHLCMNRSSWITNKDGQPGYWFSGESLYTESAPQVFFPAAGYRDYSFGKAMERGRRGNYWSSECKSHNDDAYMLDLDASEVSLYGDARAIGVSVRCVQE